MALTLEEFQTHKEHRVFLQRLALWYAERGEDRLSRDIQAASFRASKLLPAKQAPAADPAPASPVAPLKTTKEKAA